ncbi:hypothetical protein AAC387_Pa06g0334 [Persea americana]
MGEIKHLGFSTMAGSSRKSLQKLFFPTLSSATASLSKEPVSPSPTSMPPSRNSPQSLARDPPEDVANRAPTRLARQSGASPPAVDSNGLAFCPGPR